MNRDRIHSVLVFLGVFVFLLFRVLFILARRGVEAILAAQRRERGRL